MNAPVEAQSLSSLTHLLANPPQYPRNPTHELHEPLVLYIVRVPGSQDVFLTPTKPPTKISVSLDAINSSLYYFHVETAEDMEIKKSIEQSTRTSDESQRSVTSIARKPVPASAHPPPPPPHLHLPHSSLRNTRVIGSDHELIETAARLHIDTSHHAVHRKPINEMSGSQLLHATREGALPDSPQNTRLQPEKGNALSPTASHFRRPYVQTTQSSRSLELQSRVARRLAPTITIIRRDPATAVQWNVGTISQLQPTFSGSVIKPLEIHLTTPGYVRFSRQSEVLRPNSAGSDAASIRRAMADALSEPQFARYGDEPYSSFSRVVDFQNMTTADLNRHVYQRNNSFDSTSNMDAAKMLQQKHVLQFASPWNGTCTFVNAIDGKTLKIKHTIGNTVSTLDSVTNKVAELRFNLSSSIFDSFSRHNTPDHEEEYLPVSELIRTKKENFRRSLQNFRHKSWEDRRGKKQESSLPSSSFTYAHDPLRDLTNINMPTTNNLSSSSAAPPHYLSHDTRSTSYDDKHYDHDYNNDNDNANDRLPIQQNTQGRISLKLGRERAGGGFRGQSAKLGKLIIEDEGLKMCDLVVAACMGVWWQHYDRTEY